MEIRTISKTIDLKSPSEAVDKYITKIGQDGIHVHPEGNSVDGVIITDSISIVTNGTPVASYGAETIIGDENGFHIKIGVNDAEGRLSFYQGKDNEVAYITNNQLYITQSVVLEQMDIGELMSDNTGGQWSWKVSKNTQGKNNLYLKWIG